MEPTDPTSEIDPDTAGPADDTADHRADLPADGAADLPAGGAAGDTAGDPADQAGAGPDLDHIGRQLADVEAALERLDAGTYWIDEVTAEPIADHVLDADPLARRAST